MITNSTVQDVEDVQVMRERRGGGGGLLGGASFVGLDNPHLPCTFTLAQEAPRIRAG